jgi:P4 family phage/plasmid primase-like protien
VKDGFCLEDAFRFLSELESGGRFTFQTFADSRDKSISPKLLHGTLEEHVEELKRINLVGGGVFVTINETNGEGRKASDVVRVRAHFIDSDTEPIDEVCRRFPLKPHIMVETSEGKGHAYYRVSDTPLEEFTQIQARLIRAFGTDPVIKDLSRTMRLPGFYHMKGQPRLVRLLHVEEGRPPYRREEIVAALPESDLEVSCSKPSSPRPRNADPSIPQADGFRTETLTSLVGKLLARRMEDEEIFKWITAWNLNNTPPLPEEKLWQTIQSMRKTDQRNHPQRYGGVLELTDTGNAKRLVGTYGDDLRYCHDRSEWLIWDGRRWLWDDNQEIRRRAIASAMGIMDEADGLTAIEEVERARRWARQSLSMSSIKNMVTLAQADFTVSITSSRLDENDWLLNVANGTLDLKAIKFRMHSRSDMNTKMAHVEYDATAQCPQWQQFLVSIFQGDTELIGWLQKVVGYSLTGSIEEQCGFFLIGDGCNGKSTFLNVLKNLMGDYAVQGNPDSFMANRYNSAGAARSDLMRLPGARLVAVSEGEEGQRLAESFIKQCTGGEAISTRGLYEKKQIEYTPKFKLFYCSNHKPVISSTDYGIWRRIRIIPFLMCIPEAERDPHLLTKLCTEGAGILNWAYEGCIRWQEEGLKELPLVVQQAVAEYKGENDVIGRFIADRCAAGGTISSSELYEAYLTWSHANSEPPKSQVLFSQYLTRNGYAKERSKYGVSWSGLRLCQKNPVSAEAV